MSALNAKSMFPSLTASDLTRSLHFYVDGLGFEIVDRSEVDGVLHFAMLKAGSAMLGIGQDDFAKGRDRAKGIGARFWIQTSRTSWRWRTAPRSPASRLTPTRHRCRGGPWPLPWWIPTDFC